MTRRGWETGPRRPAERRLLRALSRWMWRLRRVGDGPDDAVRVESFRGLSLRIPPGVFNGVRLRTGAFLAEALEATPAAPRERVLDLGTGSGIGALVAARRGAHVIATDVNPLATRCAELNARANGWGGWIEVRVGDLFEPVAGARFDLVLFNPPYYHGAPRDALDQAWRSGDVFERFLDELPAHLAPGGRALIVLSSDGDIGVALERARLAVRALAERDLWNEVLTVYELRTLA